LIATLIAMGKLLGMRDTGEDGHFIACGRSGDTPARAGAAWNLDMRPLASLCASLLALVLGLEPAPARAWGRDAHRVVADLAQDRLRPAARAEVARLLALEPAARLEDVANWADEQRRDGLADVAGSPTDRRSHFVNFRGGCEYVPSRDCPDGRCVIAAINRQFLVLSDARRPDGERLIALKMLVHLVADEHQPLHASPVDDHGGNDYQVSLDGTGSNLHAVWDRTLPARSLADAHRDAAGFADELRARPALPADATAQSDRPAVDWALESCRLVRDGGIYPPGHKVDDAYLAAHRGQMEMQLRRAGERLGDMLDYALDPSSRRTTP
jgi:hypothetical protein